ncbi:Methyltransferase type 11 [uncultured Mycobacterium sp.]|uniref:Methyltransferase type 11 n=1 Tax=uncultured Mycobacterium sp. TaxID=171292 RepID=A0A1Y5PB31_9MYCO|nr:Methyltransferase type 11 [uncultured Mycobacterium sp.]
MSNFLRTNFGPVVRSKGKEAFLKHLPPDARVLDVGCGNNSPARSKIYAPTIHYTGLDIGDYNQSDGSIESADRYVLTNSEDFASTIESMADSFDAVVSAHNLEHCKDPDETLRAMCGALTRGGQLFLAFPCEASVNFPSRARTLNFYDDPTHQKPINLSRVFEILSKSGMTVSYSVRRYRPPLLAAAGLLLEPVAALSRRSMPLTTTWALYGFETVIWADRR